MSRGARTVFGVAALAALTGDASAHAPMPGIVGFYAGIVHPVSTPFQVLALVAAAAMFGQRWPQNAGQWLGAFALAVIAGIASGQLGAPPIAANLGLLLSATTTSLFAAAFPAGAALAGAVAAAIAGFFIGLASTPEQGGFWPTAVTLAGAFVGANIALAYLAFASASLRLRFDRPWMAVGFRIVSAWIAAVAIMMSALYVVQSATRVPI